MLEFFSNNSDSISAITNLLFLLVWGVYLQIFLLEFRRERKPRVILHQTGEMDLDSVCMISNMSKEPVDIVLITAVCRLKNGGEEHLQITDRQHGPNIEHLDSETNQGPLASGNYFGLVRFRSLFDQVKKNSGSEETVESIHTIELRVVFTYGPRPRLSGARRSFRISRTDDRLRVIPEFLDTDQLRSFRERKALSRWLHESVPT